MLNESSLLLEKQIYVMILNWNLTSLSFCDLPVTFSYRDWNDDGTTYLIQIISFRMKKKKPRKPKSQTTQMLKSISGQCSLSLPFENRRKPLVNHCFLGVKREHWSEMDWLFEKGNKESTCMQHGISLQNVTWTGAKNNTPTTLLS